MEQAGKAAADANDKQAGGEFVQSAAVANFYGAGKIKLLFEKIEKMSGGDVSLFAGKKNAFHVKN